MRQEINTSYCFTFFYGYCLIDKQLLHESSRYKRVLLLLQSLLDCYAKRKKLKRCNTLRNPITQEISPCRIIELEIKLIMVALRFKK